MLTCCAYIKTNFPCILNGDKIKITHNIAAINLHSFINIAAMSRCVNVCPILTNPDTYVNQFLETSLQWGTVSYLMKQPMHSSDEPGYSSLNRSQIISDIRLLTHDPEQSVWKYCCLYVTNNM